MNITLTKGIFLLFASCSWVAATPAAPAYTFWYGPNPPVNQLARFDRIIIEADNFSDRELAGLKRHNGKVLAYFSVGEWNTQRATNHAIDTAWIIDGNPHWNSKIMDLTAGGWQQFLTRWAESLLERGAQGLFLDTLDSYMLPKMSATQREKQRQGLVTFIKQLKAAHPDLLLVANRGFEVMDEVAPYLEAVAAESLYQGWNNTEQQYLPVAENDRAWLRNSLRAVQAKYALDIVVLDYLPPDQREKALETAAKIKQDGFIPWVATPAFDYLGVGAPEVESGIVSQ